MSKVYKEAPLDKKSEIADTFNTVVGAAKNSFFDLGTNRQRYDLRTDEQKEVCKENEKILLPFIFEIANAIPETVTLDTITDSEKSKDLPDKEALKKLYELSKGILSDTIPTIIQGRRNSNKDVSDEAMDWLVKSSLETKRGIFSDNAEYGISELTSSLKDVVRDRTLYRNSDEEKIAALDILSDLSKKNFQKGKKHI